jgi:hypothetical protein
MECNPYEEAPFVPFITNNIEIISQDVVIRPDPDLRIFGPAVFYCESKTLDGDWQLSDCSINLINEK